MKSRTSFSKLTTFKKNIFRFAPIWALYLIVMMLVLVGETGMDYDHFARNYLPEWIASFGVVNLILAGVVGQALFGDLYNTRMCYALHSLPQRRESWLISHLGAGVMFALVPNVLATAFLMTQLEAYWYLALYTLLAVMLQYLFFLGVAAVSSLMAGNRFAMLALYALINFVSMLAYATVQLLFIPTITGVVANIRAFSRFSPVVYLFNMDFFRFSSHRIPDPYSYNGYRNFYVYEGLDTGWGYTAILGGLGLVAMGVALWLYRKRHLEAAGDFLAFPRLKSVMCVILTVCVALCFALLGEAFGSGYFVWMAMGLVIGFFGSLMLLERRIKVFRKKTLLGFGLVVAVVALSMAAVAFDWLGIESWTPNANRVQSVTVTNSSASSYLSENLYGDRLRTELTEEGDIAQIIKAHEDILSRLDFRKTHPNATTHRVTLVYKMKSGRTVTRTYSAPASGINYEIITAYLYTKDSVLGFQDVETAAKQAEHMYLQGTLVPMEYYGDILKALALDFDAGTVSRDYQGDHYLEYSIRLNDGTVSYRTLFFGKEAVNLMQQICRPEWQMGYSDWETFLKTVQNVKVGPDVVRGDDQIALLEAIRKDVEAGNLMAGDYKTDPIFEVEYTYWRADGSKDYRYFSISKLAEHTRAWYEAYKEKADAWNPEGI